MTHPRDYLPILDRIGPALDATRDALMTLQSIDVLPGHRRANQRGLALGFVLAREGRNEVDDSQPDQSSPRRTA